MFTFADKITIVRNSIMRLKELTYKDSHRQWGFSGMTFNRVTLLVGASGVGKTQILRSIDTLVKIARGNSMNGVEWSVAFEHGPHSYAWQGKFETMADKEVYVWSRSDIDDPKCRLQTEYITMDGTEIVSRKDGEIIFNNSKTIELPDTQSAVFLLRSTPYVAPIYTAFMSVFDLDMKVIKLFRGSEQIKDIPTTDEAELVASSFPVNLKLYEAYMKGYPVYGNIKRQFCDIFPMTEDLRIGYFTKKGDTLRVQIKERGVEAWIDQSNISAGMMRTLYQIAQVYLSAPGSVILIDEFENSLGINCIDAVTSDVVAASRAQFVLTSHHPYIINNIPTCDWKVVTRKGGDVMIRNAHELNIGQSRHDAFIQLLNAIDQEA